MAMLTWVGGGNDRVDDPRDWSSSGMPQVGDTLQMTSGLMNIKGYNLPPGDYLQLTGPDILGAQSDVTLNLSQGSSFTTVVYSDHPEINVSGTDTLILGSAYQASPIADSWQITHSG